MSHKVQLPGPASADGIGIVGNSNNGRPRLLLSAPSDPRHLTDLVCLLRSQIEVFPATPLDEAFRSRRGGLKEPIALGRVGIRCVHCAHRPLADRPKGAVGYPKSISLVHQAVRNWQRYHFLVCSDMPPKVVTDYHKFKGTSRKLRTATSSDYWVEGCEMLGLVDAGQEEGGGIRFRGSESRPVRSEVSSAALRPLLTASSDARNSACLVLPIVTGGDGDSLREADDSDCDEGHNVVNGILGRDCEDREVDQQVQAEPIGGSDGAIPTAAKEQANPATKVSLPPPPVFTSQEQQQQEVELLAALSPTEIAKAEADLHGITSSLGGIGIGEKEEAERSSRRAQQNLLHLDAEVANIPSSQKSAYLQAVAQCPQHVNDDHKMSFLERENYNVPLAAQRLVKYWETKLAAFGVETCFLPLTLRGAMRGEVSGLIKYCPYQILRVRDTAGRAIVYFDRSRRDLKRFSTKSMMMALWYTVETAAENPQVRNKGVIFLSSGKAEGKNYESAVARFFAVFWSVSPVAIRSLHVCYPSRVAYYLIAPLFKFFIGRENALRLKMHYGSEEKVLRVLEGYCLPKDRVPVQLGGEVVLDIEEWVKDRLQLEEKQTEQRCHYLDRVAGSDAGGRGAKRMREDTKQGVCCDSSSPSTDSSLLSTGSDDAQTSLGIRVSSELATTDTCNESVNVAGRMFQGETSIDSVGQDRAIPNTCIDDELLPAFTTQDELQELAALSPVELARAEAESYGLPQDRVPEQLGGDVVLDVEKRVNGRLLLEQRQVNSDHNLDTGAVVDAGGRATKRVRNQCKQGVHGDQSLSSMGSLFPTVSYAQGSLGIDHQATLEPAANACNGLFNSIAGTSFQGETPTICIGELRIGRERRDSFYESIMELPGIEDLGTI